MAIQGGNLIGYTPRNELGSTPSPTHTDWKRICYPTMPTKACLRKQTRTFLRQTVVRFVGGAEFPEKHDVASSHRINKHIVIS